jgi:hypothetical protein
MPNANAIRTILIATGLFLLSAASVTAQTVVDQGKTHTPRGVGGYYDIAYAFAQGDVVTLKARSSKLLARVVATLYPDVPLARVRDTKRPELSFTVPQEGIVVIRFVSDRNGEANIDYTVTRTPGPNGPAEYNTNVKWKEPIIEAGGRIPERDQ